MDQIFKIFTIVEYLVTLKRRYNSSSGWIGGGKAVGLGNKIKGRGSSVGGAVNFFKNVAGTRN